MSRLINNCLAVIIGTFVLWVCVLAGFMEIVSKSRMMLDIFLTVIVLQALIYILFSILVRLIGVSNFVFGFIFFFILGCTYLYWWNQFTGFFHPLGPSAVICNFFLLIAMIKVTPRITKLP